MERIGASHHPCGPGLRWAGGVERSRATDAARLWRQTRYGRAVRTSKPSGHGAIARGAGHSAWPNARYVINALANSMRSGVAGPTPVKDCASQQLRQLGDIRRNAPRLIFMPSSLGQILLNLVLARGLVMGRPRKQRKERALCINRIEHLLRIRCSFCGAPAGELCRTEAGREILLIGLMHNARITPTRANERYRRYR